jgi:hypothetical protein
MGITRSSFVIALTAPAVVCGCFALFSLDEYGPNSVAPNDGGGGDSDGAGDATVDATKPPRIVFVTSERFLGSMGGVGGANNRCDALAADAGIDASFAAWLGGDNNGPARRLDDPDRSLEDRTGARVAANLGELAQRGPSVAILVTEKKTRVDAAGCDSDRVWTNATGEGKLPEAGFDCDAWSDVTAVGLAGMLGGMTNDEWTSGCGTPRACTEQAHLYCFEK